MYKHTHACTHMQCTELFYFYKLKNQEKNNELFCHNYYFIHKHMCFKHTQLNKMSLIEEILYKWIDKKREREIGRDIYKRGVWCDYWGLGGIPIGGGPVNLILNISIIYNWY